MTPIRETIARAICEETNGCSAGGCSIGIQPESCLRRHGGTADAVLRALDAAGMAVVPKEASAEMLAAAGDAFVDAIYGHVPGDLPGANAPFRRFYRAMIAAAPDVVE